MGFPHKLTWRRAVPFTMSIIFTLLLLSIIQDSSDALHVPLLNNKKKKAAEAAAAAAALLAEEERLLDIKEKLYLITVNVVCFAIILLFQVMEK
mmetsp:Transcript_14079/g.28083  ORF Transcript_14079/g.28083 Transcript_14079/m.28083 type:complete len:94 (+) Transcript_14079:163-444(+)